MRFARYEEVAVTRVSLFNSPLLLGFDHFERTLERIAKNGADGYPPYNIERVGENGLRITLAVAGFTSDDLAIEVADNQLMVRGRQSEDPERVFLHRGIAARQFQKSFVLAEGIEVKGASLDNGLLNIELERPPVEARVRSVAIKSGNASSKSSPQTIDVNAEPNQSKTA
jgi:HSP20 family molecular chaperone IbpA